MITEQEKSYRFANNVLANPKDIWRENFNEITLFHILFYDTDTTSVSQSDVSPLVGQRRTPAQFLSLRIILLVVVKLSSCFKQGSKWSYTQSEFWSMVHFIWVSFNLKYFIFDSCLNKIIYISTTKWSEWSLFVLISWSICNSNAQHNTRVPGVLAGKLVPGSNFLTPTQANLIIMHRRKKGWYKEEKCKDLLSFVSITHLIYLFVILFHKLIIDIQ